jgi:hypothetical protein
MCRDLEPGRSARIIYDRLCSGVLREESRQIYRDVITDLVEGQRRGVITTRNVSGEPVRLSLVGARVTWCLQPQCRLPSALRIAGV